MARCLLPHRELVDGLRIVAQDGEADIVTLGSRERRQQRLDELESRTDDILPSSMRIWRILSSEFKTGSGVLKHFCQAADTLIMGIAHQLDRLQTGQAQTS